MLGCCITGNGRLQFAPTHPAPFPSLVHECALVCGVCITVVRACLWCACVWVPCQVAGGEVIVKYCPLCSKPHLDKADNLWKLYFSQATGAYNCFRCGNTGSLFQFKEKV
jgi:hypothetical protein